MRVRNHILSILNSDGDFFSESSVYFGEPAKNVQKAFGLIIYTIIYAVTIQCVLNKRTDEIYKIAKECTSVGFGLHQFASNSQLVLKGRGANSELIGNKLSATVNIIAQLSGLKNSTVNRLFSLLSPVILSDLYFNYKASYSESRLASHLESLNRDGEKLPAGIKNELNELITDEEKKRAYAANQNKTRIERYLNRIRRKPFL